MFLFADRTQGSIAGLVGEIWNGRAPGVCGTVWNTAAVHCALGRAALARRFCVRRVRRAGGLAAEGASSGFECGKCHRQKLVTAGTVFHRTRTDLAKWFLAAYLMARDKRGVSAKFLQRELGVAYQTAWTMAHKLRHGLSEDPARPLCGLLEADETFIGGRGTATSRGRSAANPDKSLVVAAVEKVPAPKNKKGNRARGQATARLLRRQRPDRRAAGGDGRRTRRLSQSQCRSQVAPPDRRVRRLSRPRCRLGEHLKHTPVIQDGGSNAGEFFPIIHTLFSNIKAWLVGTHHGVSAKHLPRYLREWSYRFNRRNLPDGLDGDPIRRAVECATITYDQLKAGAKPGGADRLRRPHASVVQPALTA